jgi:hypothetical protein
MVFEGQFYGIPEGTGTADPSFVVWCYAVSASGNWRITFGWIEGDAVDLEDYH